MSEGLEGIVRVRNVCPEDLLDNFDLYEKLDGAGLDVIFALLVFSFHLCSAAKTAFEEACRKRHPFVRTELVTQKVLGPRVRDGRRGGLGGLGK